jgi:hypothetical protein
MCQGSIIILFTISENFGTKLISYRAFKYQQSFKNWVNVRVI